MSAPNLLCPNCGTPELPRANVCPNCGYIGVWPPPPFGVVAPLPSPKEVRGRRIRRVLTVLLIILGVAAVVALGALAVCYAILSHANFH